MQTLIAVGRATLLAAALLTVLASTVAGWLFGQAQDRFYGLSAPVGQISTTAPGYAVFGLIVGVIMAGSAFGVLAAIFDMQQSLRLLVERGPLHSTGRDGAVIAMPPAQRIEPQLRA